MNTITNNEGMTYRQCKAIAEGLLKADRLALIKMETADALRNIDMKVSDDQIDEVCDIIHNQYREYLSTKWAKGDVYDFAYGINECLANMDEPTNDPVTALGKIDWNWVFDYVSEME